MTDIRFESIMDGEKNSKIKRASENAANFIAGRTIEKKCHCDYYGN